MVDSLLALGIISLGLFSLVGCQKVLSIQQDRQTRQLTAARLAKEASDGYRLYHRPVTIKRLGYRAVAGAGKVIVRYQGRVILRVTA